MSYLGSSLLHGSAFLAAGAVVFGTVYAAATLWAPGSAPQTGPTGGNVKPPVTAATMQKDKFCTATGSGNEIKCENTAAEVVGAAGIDGTNGNDGTTSSAVVGDQNCRWTAYTQARDNDNALAGLSCRWNSLPTLAQLNQGSMQVAAFNHPDFQQLWANHPLNRVSDYKYEPHSGYQKIVTDISGKNVITTSLAVDAAGYMLPAGGQGRYMRGVRMDSVSWCEDHGCDALYLAQECCSFGKDTFTPVPGQTLRWVTGATCNDCPNGSTNGYCNVKLSDDTLVTTSFKDENGQTINLVAQNTGTSYHGKCDHPKDNWGIWTY